jgi:hypothetical protein
VVSGRADRVGAARLAALVGALQLAATLLSMAHVGNPGEFFRVIQGLAWPLISSVVAWVLYLGLEPTIRRAWPTSLISWSRLVEGRVRDPRVCRDVLAGLAATAMVMVPVLPLGWIYGFDLGVPFGLTGQFWTAAQSLREAVAHLVNNVTQGLVIGLGVVFFYCQVRRVLRRDWIAGVVVAVLFSGVGLAGPSGLPAPVVVLSGVLGAAALLIPLIRFGLVAIGAHLLSSLLAASVLTLDPSAWYSAPSLLNLGVAVAIAIGAYVGYVQPARAGDLPVRTAHA